MTIAVEAGLGFESAMARAGRNGRGALAEELVRTLQDIAVGQPRREAYLALAERTAVPDLRRSEEHTSELQSRQYLVCRLLLEKKNTSYYPDLLSAFRTSLS